MKRKPDNHPRYLDCDKWVRLLDQLNIGAFTIDRHRRITCFNRSAKSLMGHRAARVVGKDCREVFHDIPCFSKCPFHTAADSKSSADFEIVDNQNIQHFIMRYSTPLYGPDLEMAGCLTMLQDHSPIAELISKVSYEERSTKIKDRVDVRRFFTPPFYGRRSLVFACQKEANNANRGCTGR